MHSINIDSLITVELPGERVRATVKEVGSHDKIVVELTNITMAKSHDYKQGNFVECSLKKGLFGNFWQALHKVVPVYEEEKPEKEVKNVRVRRSKSSK